MSQYQPDPTRPPEPSLPDPTTPVDAGWPPGAPGAGGASPTEPQFADPGAATPPADNTSAPQPPGGSGAWTAQPPPGAQQPSATWGGPTGALPAGAADPYGYPTVSQDDRNLAVATHLSAFPAAMIVISPLGPLTAYLLSANRPFVRANAVEALNFNLTMWIGVMVSFVLMFLGIGFITLPLFGLAMLVFHIVAALKARDGVIYRYPMSFRFFS